MDNNDLHTVSWWIEEPGFRVDHSVTDTGTAAEQFARVVAVLRVMRVRLVDGDDPAQALAALIDRFRAHGARFSLDARRLTAQGSWKETKVQVVVDPPSLPVGELTDPDDGLPLITGIRACSGGQLVAFWPNARSQEVLAAPLDEGVRHIVRELVGHPPLPPGADFDEQAAIRRVLAGWRDVRRIAAPNGPDWPPRLTIGLLPDRHRPGAAADLLIEIDYAPAEPTRS